MHEEPERGKPLRGLPGRGELILIVDDDGNLRSALARTLRGLGFSVITAVDGQDALEILKRTGVVFDALLVDVVMPRLDGPGLVERLSCTGARPKVVYMSGHENPAVSQPLGSHDPLLIKPFTPHSLVFVLREVLDRRD